MTDLLETAFSSVRSLAPARQEEVALMIMQIVRLAEPSYVLSAAEHRDLDQADDDLARGDLASAEEVDMMFSKTIVGL